MNADNSEIEKAVTTGGDSGYAMLTGAGLGAVLAVAYAMVLPAFVYYWARIDTTLHGGASRALELTYPGVFFAVVRWLLSIGFIPASVLGGITGPIIDGVIAPRYKKLSAWRAYGLGSFISVLLSTAITLIVTPGFGVLPWTGSGVPALGIPMVIYILAMGGFAGHVWRKYVRITS
jgi:hypothetical protein